MNINELISIVKIKIKKNFLIDSIEIEDKTFLHKNHQSHRAGKFHLKIIIKSQELNNLTKVESNKKIYHVLDDEIKNYIHSIQILIN
tara:strand:+ start:370 stop:630 length:261 start_codon:yes stop_codon:yes gene_type:complete